MFILISSWWAFICSAQTGQGRKEVEGRNRERVNRGKRKRKGKWQKVCSLEELPYCICAGTSDLSVLKMSSLARPSFWLRQPLIHLQSWELSGPEMSMQFTVFLSVVITVTFGQRAQLEKLPHVILWFSFGPCGCLLLPLHHSGEI